MGRVKSFNEEKAGRVRESPARDRLCRRLRQVTGDRCFFARAHGPFATRARVQKQEQQ